VETRFCESGCIRSVELGPVEHFVFGRRDVADRFEQPPVAPEPQAAHEARDLAMQQADGAIGNCWQITSTPKRTL